MEQVNVKVEAGDSKELVIRTAAAEAPRVRQAVGFTTDHSGLIDWILKNKEHLDRWFDRLAVYKETGTCQLFVKPTVQAESVTITAVIQEDSRVHSLGLNSDKRYTITQLRETLSKVVPLFVSKEAYRDTMTQDRKSVV